MMKQQNQDVVYATSKHNFKTKGLADQARSEETMTEPDSTENENTPSKSRLSALLCVCDIFTPMAWDDEDNSCAECGGVKSINYYDNVKAINKSLDAVDGILEDAKENDPEFYDELKELLNT